MKTFLHVFQSLAVFSLLEKKFVFQERVPEPTPAPETVPKKPDEGVKAEKTEKKVDQQERTKRSLEWSKKAFERERSYEQKYRHEGFKTGSAEMSQEDLEKMPGIDPHLEYRVVGGVDNSPFNPKLEHDARWYQERSFLAQEFLQLYADGKLYTEMSPEDMDQVLGAMDVLARLPDGIDSKDAKKKVDAFDANAVYGAKGAYNFLLALKRTNAVVPYDKQGRVLYDLKVGQASSPKARFTELGVKKEAQDAQDVKRPVEKPTEKPAPAPGVDVERAPETMKDYLDAFFGRDKYLSSLNSSIDTYKVTGPQRIGGIDKGVDFSDSQYVILSKGRDAVYVYADLERGEVSLRVAANVSVDPRDGLHSVLLGTIKVPDLGTQSGKDSFSLEVLKTVRIVVPPPSSSAKPLKN